MRKTSVLLAPKPYHRSLAKNRKKPQWVINEVLRLKVLSGVGCGKVAETFNRIHGHKETVSKSFVYEKLKQNQYQLLVISRNIHHKIPRHIPVNHTWGIDLTTVTIANKHKTILGIIDHGTRMNLSLTELPSKHSLNILRELAKTIRQYGLPRFIRTDNECCFTAKIIRLSLKLLGIKHQKSDIACPWQNGRIERFFGTFKEKVRQVIFTNAETFQTELDTFNLWYDYCRTHENIGGLTPKEMWLNKRDRHYAKAVWVNDWNGVLTGYYFPD